MAKHRKTIVKVPLSPPKKWKQQPNLFELLLLFSLAKPAAGGRGMRSPCGASTIPGERRDSLCSSGRGMHSPSSCHGERSRTICLFMPQILRLRTASCAQDDIAVRVAMTAGAT